MNENSAEAKPRPPWLIGLIIAVVVFIVLLVVANLLGYGDDPAVGAGAVTGAVLTI